MNIFYWQKGSDTSSKYLDSPLLVYLIYNNAIQFTFITIIVYLVKYIKWISHEVFFTLIIFLNIEPSAEITIFVLNLYTCVVSSFFSLFVIEMLRLEDTQFQRWTRIQTGMHAWQRKYMLHNITPITIQKNFNIYMLYNV